MRPGQGSMLLAAGLTLTLLLVVLPAAAVHQGGPHSGEFRIAILDSGIDAAHSEFAPGQVVAWRDFTGNAAAPFDDVGHGTAVASVAAGLNVGGSPGTKLVVARVCTASGCDLQDVAAAMFWATSNGADVINLSLGSLIPLPNLVAGLEDDIRRSRTVGTLVVVSAGNGVGNLGLIPDPSTLGQPSGSENALVVGGAGETGSAAVGFSSDPEVIHVAIDVLTAEAHAGYTRMSGTSFSSPAVAGVAVEVQKGWFAQYGEYLSIDELEDFIKWNARDLPASAPALEGYGFVPKDRLLAAIPAGMPAKPCSDVPGATGPRLQLCLNFHYVESYGNTVRGAW